ncbi:MAG: hypothetical protein KIT36_07555 [Alphaproteobacteria bacterium]|nr:hypothetical protein [Alphaproteobacteria bacterium]
MLGMRRRSNPYDTFKTLYRHPYDLPIPAGGWGAERFRLLHEKARQIAPDRHASWSLSEPPDRTRFVFLFDLERDAFRDWIETCGVDFGEPNWRVIRG